MEKQAKELTQLIDEPINTIAKQVKDYEEEQKKKKKEEILAYMAEVFAELPETVASKLNCHSEHSRGTGGSKNHSSISGKESLYRNGKGKADRQHPERVYHLCRCDRI